MHPCHRREALRTLVVMCSCKKLGQGKGWQRGTRRTAVVPARPQTKHSDENGGQLYTAHNVKYLRTERKWAGGGRVKGSLPKFTPSTVPPSSTNTGVKEAPTGRPATGTV